MDPDRMDLDRTDLDRMAPGLRTALRPSPLPGDGRSRYLPRHERALDAPCGGRGDAESGNRSSVAHEDAPDTDAVSSEMRWRGRYGV